MKPILILSLVFFSNWVYSTQVPTDCIMIAQDQQLGRTNEKKIKFQVRVDSKSSKKSIAQ